MTTLTEKQKAWDATKAANRTIEKSATHDDCMVTRTVNPIRAVRTAIRARRPRKVTGRRCPDCPHRWKHHSERGGCRRGCPCRNGADR